MRPAPTRSALTAGTTEPGGPLPLFSDWRATYLGTDGLLHAVTLDGKTDVAGPALPNLSSPAIPVTSEAFSPNGQVLAYGSVPLTIMDVAGTPATREINPTQELAWSPDGSELALGDAEGGLQVVQASGGSPVRVPGTPGQGTPGPNQSGVTDLVGWIDSTHLAVRVLPANSPMGTDPEGNTFDTTIQLGSIDITTGNLRIIATIGSLGAGGGAFSLSPDGTTALFYSEPFRADPFTPMVEEIGTADGKVTPLSAIAHATCANLTSVVWQPGANMLAVTTGLSDSSGLQTWMLDPTHDTATEVQALARQFVDGWAPNNGPLIVCNGPAPYPQVGAGPYDISAVTIGPDGHVSIIVLTHNAMTFPFLGFVRTA